MWRFIVRHRSVLPQLTYSSQQIVVGTPVWVTSRQIFTDEFLGLDEYRDYKNNVQADLNTAQLQYKPSVLKSKIQASAEKGLLLSGDLRKIFCMANNKSDVQDCAKLLARYVELHSTNAIVLANAARFVNNFYCLCHLIKLPGPAMNMFYQDFVKSREVNSFISRTSNLILLDLLYKANKHNEVVTVYSDIMERVDANCGHSLGSRPVSLLTVALLSLSKWEKSDVAFEKATSLVQAFMTKFNGEYDLGGRGSFVYSWIACKNGKYAEAYEIIYNQSNGRNSVLKLNLELFLLIKLERMNDTIVLLNDTIEENDGPQRPVNDNKPRICRDVVQCLVDAVKICDDPELVRKVTIMFKRLDSVADIIEESIEDLLYSPIDVSRAIKKQKEEDERSTKLRSNGMPRKIKNRLA